MADTLPQRIEAAEGADSLDKLAKGLTDGQREAILEGRVHDCPYNHPVGTRCPNCSSWPFKKGGAAEFRLALKAHIERNDHAE